MKRHVAEQPYLTKAGTHIDGNIFKSSWFLSTREKNLNIGMSKIDVLASKFNLPKMVVDESKLLFKKSLYSNMAVGRDQLSLIYASIYIACNIHGIPKTPIELTSYSEVNIRLLMKGYREIKRELDIKTQMINPIDLLPRYASKLNLKPETLNKSAELIIKIREQGIILGSKPDTILAASIYLAGKQTQDTRTQRKISRITGITEVTIRRVSKEIIKNIPA